MKFSRMALLAGALVLAGSALAQDKAAAPKATEKPKDGIELPLKGTRKLEFTTEEATWAALDVSPDGKTIVFELVGDIYTVSTDGGEAKLLVGGISYDGMPRFSPDGKKVVFVSDRSGADNLWVCNVDGSDLKAVTQGRDTSWLSPSFTPDSNYVLGSKATGYLPTYQMQLVDLRGGTGLKIGPATILPGTLSDARVGSTAPNRMGLTASPDGKYFFFTERKGAWQYNEDNGGQTQVFRMDRKTGQVEVMTNEDGGAMRPLVSPDSKTLLYFTRFRAKTALKALDLTTGESRWVAYPVDRDDMESRATRDLMPGYAFLPDGKSIVIGLHGKIQKMDIATGNATVIPFKAHVSQLIGDEIHFNHRVDESPMVHAKIARDAVLSPDGQKIAFCAFGKLYVADAKNGAPQKLTDLTANQFTPAWSPDGSKIVFATWDVEKGGHIYSISSSGGQATQLTRQPGYYTGPIFSPDGKSVVFSQNTVDEGFNTAVRATEPEQNEAEEAEIGRFTRFKWAYLRSIPATGGDSTLLCRNAGGGYYFRGDSNRLYRSGGGSLISVRLDGTDAITLLNVTGKGVLPPTVPNDMRLSPDGTKALIDIDSKLYIATLPATGEPLTLSVGGPNVPLKRIAVGGVTQAEWTADGKGIFYTFGNKASIYDLEKDAANSTTLDVAAQRYTPKGTILLRGARIITMKGDEVIRSGDILVVDNRIAKVGPLGSFPIPAGAEVMHMEGKTISPGYVDTHSHWFGNYQTGYPQSWGYLVNLAYGVTSQRDPQTGTDAFYDFADAITTGSAIGPRMYGTGPGIFRASGVEDQESVTSLLKLYSQAYDTHTIKEYVTGDRMVIQHVAMACKELGLTPTTEGALETKRYIAEALDGYSGHEHALPNAPLYDDMAQFIAKTHTFYTPTLIVSYGSPFGENYWFTNYDIQNEPKVKSLVPIQALDPLTRRRGHWSLPEEYLFPQIAEGCKKVVEAGGKVCVGCHGEFQGLGSHWEMWMLASGGMKPLDVLRCATLNGAEAIGLAQDIGSIEAGKFADLVIYDKNPLDNIRNTNTIHWVMKNGELFDSLTMDSVYPIKKKLPKPYWQNVQSPFVTPTTPKG